jgi:hypothetical protein
MEKLTTYIFGDSTFTRIAGHGFTLYHDGDEPVPLIPSTGTAFVRRYTFSFPLRVSRLTLETMCDGGGMNRSCNHTCMCYSHAATA